MKKTTKNFAVLAGPVVLVAVIFVASAYAATSVVHDARGDVGSSPPYLDVVHARVVEQQGTDTLLFMMLLASPIPDELSEPVVIWPFHVDTNLSTFPGGLFNDYIVRVRRLGGAFQGHVVDRTPLLSGGSQIATPISVSIDGTTVKAFVPRHLLGDPSRFRWNASTRPGATVPYVDFAPDAPNQFDTGNLATWEE